MPHTLRKFETYRRVRSYRRERLGKTRRTLSLPYQLDDARLESFFIQDVRIFFHGTVQVLYRAELPYQLGGRLFADPLDAGNVVRRVAAQGFVVGHILRVKTEALAYRPFVVENRVGKAFAERIYFHPLPYELERIKVARGNDGLYVAAW